jgi:outer membrane receptor for ferrienterochelin and colicin
MKALFLFSILIAFGLAPNVAAQDDPPLKQDQQPRKHLATLHGRVVDARTGEPIAKVRVIANDTEQSTTTDENGSFTLENLPAGKVELYITTVSFGLVKKTITLKEGDNSDIQIALNDDAAALTEKVTVVGNPFESTETNAASEYMLNKRELQQLSSMLVGDPIRAAQALPGATTNDDYRSEFAVRGAGFDRIGLYLDGILTENFVHTIAGGYPDTGSLSVINADTVDSVSLMSGAFSSRYGDRTAAVLDIQTRDGNRVKTNGRVSASLTGLGAVIDGPLAHGRGSYLVAGRKSYVGYIVRRFNDQFHYTNNPPILNFEDGQGKFIYDLTKHSQVGFSLVFGDFVFDRNRDRLLLGLNQVFRGNSRNLLVNGHWNFTPNPKVFWQTRVFGLRTTFRNTNLEDKILEDGRRTQLGVRSDVSYQVRPSHRFEAGLYLRRLNVDNLSQIFGYLTGGASDFGSFKRSETEQGYFAQDTWSNERRGLSLTAGARVEHSSVTGETNFSPRGSLAWSIDRNWKVRAAAGRYYQFPDFEPMFGRLGNPVLRSERATHYNASVERLLGNRTRVLAEGYDREDANLFFSLNEPRLIGNTFTFAAFPSQNSLRGHARGFELTVQRRSANKLAGWISYAYSRTNLSDARDRLIFPSDTDQRHTFNAYGNYRITGTWNLSGEWRYGSGEPIPGFIRQVGADYFLSTQRNLTRLPYYNRIDVRASKAFLFKKAKLTLTGEVLNLLNRNNLRYAGFDFYDVTTGRVFGQLDRVLPLIPSVGIVIEF